MGEATSASRRAREREGALRCVYSKDGAAASRTEVLGLASVACQGMSPL